MCQHLCRSSMLLLWESGAQGTNANMLTLWLLFLLQGILSDPGVLCFPPASMVLGQANISL